jgi:TatD DNase family protein
LSRRWREEKGKSIKGKVFYTLLAVPHFPLFPYSSAMIPTMIDTHCHLDHCANPDQAADPSLLAIVSIGTTLERCHTTLQLAEKHPNVWAAVGIHPNNASEAKSSELRMAIEELANHPKVVGIGETGFDSYWDDETLQTQAESFLWQADLAKRLNKPLILHVRDKQNREDASLSACKMLHETGSTKGILHCFNGHAKLLETGLELGWMISFAGNLTYKKTIELHAAAKQLPQDKIILETDSPFLSPLPKRGEKNQPSYVHYTAAFLAELRGETLSEVERYTDANAKRIYGLL